MPTLAATLTPAAMRISVVLLSQVGTPMPAVPLSLQVIIAIMLTLRVRVLRLFRCLLEASCSPRRLEKGEGDDVEVKDMEMVHTSTHLVVYGVRAPTFR